MSTFGSDLLQQLMDEEMGVKTSKSAEVLRDLVVPAIHELVDQGARIRPLLLKKEHVGYVRGLHGSERRLIQNWYPDPEMRILQIVAHGTTMSLSDIETLSGTEIQNLIRQIDTITQADFSLYPYISAFTTTSVSELLWYGRGAQCATWSRNRIEIPGGWSFNLLAPPEHARLWAGVAALRERSKKRLDDTFNAAMITRAMVGRGADKLYQSLKKTQKLLQSDILDAWIHLVPPDVAEVNLKDGWGHAFSDDTREGLMRELSGMEHDDKHEMVMKAFYEQQMNAARAQQASVEQTLEDAVEGVEDFATILTSYQVRAMEDSQMAQRQGREAAVREELEEINAVVERRERRAEGKGETPRF